MKYICLDCREAKVIRGRRVVILVKKYTRKEAVDHAVKFNHSLAKVDGKGTIKGVLRWGLFGYSQTVKNNLPDFLESYKTQERVGKIPEPMKKWGGK